MDELKRQNRELVEELKRTNQELMQFAVDLDAKVEEKTRTIQAINAQLEERIEQRTKELAAANKELESFAYSVSHDLRAPLRSIDGFSQALLEDFPEIITPETNMYFDRIRNSTRQMGNLIDDLLELSRITRTSFHPISFNLALLAQEAMQFCQQTHTDRDLNFICPDELPAVADVGLMRIVMNNLIGNAWKYTSKKDKAVIRFGENRINQSQVFFVQDNGAGFDNAFVHTLFEPFQRLHPNSEFEGTGVGLATVSRVIHRHGGKIWGEGKEGEGATFYFTLPAHAEEYR